MRTVYLNIGSNRGDRRANIDTAVAALLERFGNKARLRTSPTIRTMPQGYDSPNPFVNMGVALDFVDETLVPEPLALLDAVQDIERSIAPDSPHRNPDGTYRDRVVDIDIVDIDGITMDTPRLTIPHLRAETRRFVMQPMQFLHPGWTPQRTHARKKTAAEMHRLTVGEFRDSEKSPVAVVLDNVRSVNNIGSIFRTADAFRVQRVVLCGISATPPHPGIHKTALGAEESVDWQYFDTTAEAVSTLRNDGWTIACLEQVHGSIPLCDFRPAPGQRVAIVAGNEVTGVADNIVADADICLEIPQSGTKHSLNVAVSSAIAMWHLYQSAIR